MVGSRKLSDPRRQLRHSHDRDLDVLDRGQRIEEAVPLLAALASLTSTAKVGWFSRSLFCNSRSRDAGASWFDDDECAGKPIAKLGSEIHKRLTEGPSHA